jgi:L-rhamnose mutarotase
MQDEENTRRRAGAVVNLAPGALAEYRRLHDNIWPEVAAANREAGITNHSIFLLRDTNLLFSYYEFVGDDRAASSARLAANPAMQAWWRLCRPLQIPVKPTKGERRWTDIELIFHQP